MPPLAATRILPTEPRVAAAAVHPGAMIISSEAVAEQETSAAAHNPAVTAQEGLTAALGAEAQSSTPGMREEHRAPEGAVAASAARASRAPTSGSASAAAAAFRAELEQRLEELNLPKDRAVKIWVADEACFGRHTQSRRCWARRGQRVVLAQEQRYEWEYV